MDTMISVFIESEHFGQNVCGYNEFCIHRK